jgi:hypothetical protein
MTPNNKNVPKSNLSPYATDMDKYELWIMECSRMMNKV